VAGFVGGENNQLNRVGVTATADKNTTTNSSAVSDL